MDRYKLLIIIGLFALMSGLHGCGGGSAGSSSGASSSTSGLIASSTNAFPGEVTLDWVSPISREDGSPLNLYEIQGYKIYYGTVSGSYTEVIEIGSQYQSGLTLEGLQPGTYYLAITVVDLQGSESQYSEEIEFMVS